MKAKSLLSLLMLLSVLSTGSSAQPGWSRQSPVPPVQSLSDVCFTDASIGTAVGYDMKNGSGTILRTTDGGAHWANQRTDMPVGLNGVWFTDANDGSVVGDGGTIIRTTDGGGELDTSDERHNRAAS